MIKYKAGIRGIEKDGHTMMEMDIVNDLNRKAYLEEKYQELLYEVQNKIDGEDRHDTAKRIIRDSYKSSNTAATMGAWIDNLPD